MKPSPQRVAYRYAAGELELHLYDFDGTLFRSPVRPDWWGKRSWWVEPESLGPPCVPLKPGSDWWISSTVRDAKRSISDPNVWAILCTGRADTGSLRYRVAELLKQKGLNFDEVYLSKGGQDAPTMYKINVMNKILMRNPDISTVQIWEDQNLPRYVKAIESTGRTCIPHPVKVAPHEVECTEEDLERVVEEGWSSWRKVSAFKGFDPKKIKAIESYLDPARAAIEKRVGKPLDFPPVRTMTEAEISEGRKVRGPGHEGGAGHGLYDSDAGVVAINKTMGSDGILANFVHENLHFALPDKDEVDIDRITDEVLVEIGVERPQKQASQGITLVRIGGLSPVKQRGNSSAPEKKGIYAFVWPNIEPFLLGSTDHRGQVPRDHELGDAKRPTRGEQYHKGVARPRKFHYDGLLWTRLDAGTYALEQRKGWDLVEATDLARLARKTKAREMGEAYAYSGTAHGRLFSRDHWEVFVPAHKGSIR